MKVIVTGGAGFLGSHLCDRLVLNSHQVICLDNLITSDESNISHLKGNSKFSFLKLDVSDPLPESLEADQIYHLASPASPNLNNHKSYHALPFETMRANTSGTWNLASLAVKLKAKFLFASTSEVYGEPLEHPQKEKYRGNVSTTGPRSVYDESKRFGETITSAFVRSKNLDGRVVRIFNTYGPKMPDDGRAVIEFLNSSLENKPITIFGDGKQTRSFCYVSDLIKGIVLAMEAKDTKGEVINLGNPQEITIGELANKIKKMTSSSSKVKKTFKLPQDDPLRRCPDITKAQQLLNWSPEVSLQDGLEKLIDYTKGLN